MVVGLYGAHIWHSTRARTSLNTALYDVSSGKSIYYVN